MVGWTKTKTCLQQSTLSPKSLWPETLSSPDQLVCWGVSSITSVFWDIHLRMWKTSLLPSPVNCFRTSFAILTPLKVWGRPGNNPSLPLQLRESTLLCGHMHASAMHTVHRMVSNNPPPPKKKHISQEFSTSSIPSPRPSLNRALNISLSWVTKFPLFLFCSSSCFNPRQGVELNHKRHQSG